MSFIKSKAKALIDRVKVISAFNKNKNCIKLMLIRGSNPISNAIFARESCCFYILKEKIEFKAKDLVVTSREELFQILNVDDNASVEIEINGQSENVDAICLTCKKYVADDSIFDIVLTQKQTINQTLNINIDSISDSSISNIGQISASNYSETVLLDKWSKIKRELNWRFDYKEHDKFIKSVDEAILNKSSDFVDVKAKEKSARILGAFIGELISTFTTCLISFYSKR